MRRKILDSRPKATARRAFEDAVRRALAFSVANNWSQKELVRRLDISWGTWKRAIDGELDPVAWLPRIRAAVARLSA